MRARLLLIAGGLLLGLCLSELYARFLPRPESCLVPHPFLNHSWRPNATCESQNLLDQHGRPYVIRYNDQGWREERDFAPEKPRGVFRLFFVGDSFTAGTAPQPSTMPRLVARALQPRFDAAGRSLEVINTGTSSFSPAIYYVLLKRVLLGFAPDLIVINVDMTDPFDDFIYLQAARRASDGTIEAIPPESSFSYRYTRSGGGVRRKGSFELLTQYAARYSRLAAFAHERMLDQIARSAQADPDLPLLYEWCLPEWSARAERDARVSMDLLRQTVRLAQAAKTRVVLSAAPRRDQLAGPPARFSSLRPFEAVRAVAEELGAPYFDSYPVMREAAQREGVEALFIPNDMHYNERGYAAWAAGYARFFEERAELLR